MLHFNIISNNMEETRKRNLKWRVNSLARNVLDPPPQSPVYFQPPPPEFSLYLRRMRV